jgi:bilirubin oxidase
MKTRLMLLIVGIANSIIAQNPVLLPDTISGTDFDLTIQHGTYQFFDGQITNTMGVNGNILGPTLIMNKEDEVNIEVTNNLDDTTTIHWHGMHVSAENDGGPHTYILSGETWNPSFTVMDHAGTYWYHPHLHHKTNLHVSKGIAGFIIVRDEEEAQLNLPRTYGVDDFPLAIQTKDFDENNQVITPSNSDDVVMVNATIDASLEVPAQVVRLRLLNGTSQRVLNIGLSNNQSFYQIGSDGGLLDAPINLTRLMLAPGERAELLLDLSGMQGQTFHLMSYASELQDGIYGATNPGMMSMMSLSGYNPNPINGNNYNIMELNVVDQTPNPVLDIPNDLVTVTPIPESSADLTRNLTFTPAVMGPNQLNGHFLINGVSFDMDVINYTIPLDNIEIWSFFNQSGIAHPFHIHDVQFFVLDRNGALPPLSEQGRKDVILIKPMETVRFITQFNDFANPDVPYMYHCHMLVHEDDAMMGQFVVVDNTTRISQKKNDSNKVLLFPNPVDDASVTIKLDNKIDSYDIINTQGEIVASKTITKNVNEVTIDINQLTEGLYVIKINSGLDQYSKKFIRK